MIDLRKFQFDTPGYVESITKLIQDAKCNCDSAHEVTLYSTVLIL